MLTFYDRARRLGRREFLRVGSLALGGLALPHLLQTGSRAATVKNVLKDRSVIFLFLHGGPSQTETFDPKMTAPAGVRSATGEIATRLPGVTFGSTFARLAQLADRLTVVRSFQTGNGNHDIKPVVTDATANANLGSIYARVAGTNHPHTGIPTTAALFPRAVAPETQPANLNFGNFSATGSLGAAYAPFVPGGGGTLEQDMQLSLPRQRLDDRRALLVALDRLQHKLDADGSLDSMDHFRQQAFSTILGGAARALDLTQEDPRTVARYDTAPLVRPDQISRQWNNYDNYVDNAKSLGKLLLMARRLCEAGCGFVTVTTNFVWDMHADQNNAGVEEGMRYMGVPLDYAVSALIEDIEARGLRDKILLVCCGEMGRTPKINQRGGRDHWGALAPLLLFGGGLAMGQVIGQSTRDAGEPQSTAYGCQHLVSTIMHTLIDVGQARLLPGMPAEVAHVVTSGQPIDGLL